jgi:hypothetical protein
MVSSLIVVIIVEVSVTVAVSVNIDVNVIVCEDVTVSVSVVVTGSGTHPLMPNIIKTDESRAIMFTTGFFMVSPLLVITCKSIVKMDFLIVDYFL